MTPRERVLLSLSHREPDRIPVDLGSTGDTTILVQPYALLRHRLGLPAGKLRLCNVLSQCAYVEEDVRQTLGLDATGIYFQPRAWRTATIHGGLAAQVPAGWITRTLQDGSEVREDASGIITHKRPQAGFYFDSVHSPLSEVASVTEMEAHRDLIETFDRPGHLDKSFEELGLIAKEAYEKTDYAVVGYFGGHIFMAALQLRGWQEFMIDLITGSALADALLNMLTEAHIRHLDRFAATVGKYVHVVHVEDDLGMQDRPLLSPALYRNRIKPYHQRLYRAIKKQCGAYLMLHSDGSIYPLIPDLIEIGVDVLNPVQYTARDMDTNRLKREFGSQLSFWGGGCDTQQVLPFGTPAQVKEEVMRRIDDLAPGGGFVFAQVHNIQPQVPMENVLAMYEAVRRTV
jgi:uroporphyrinogen decarboxylase